VLIRRDQLVELVENPVRMGLDQGEIDQEEIGASLGLNY
jgi:hypothetical protein